MEWLLGNIGNLLDIGGGVVGLGTAVVTVASALDRTTPKINLQDTIKDTNKVLGIISRVISFLAMNNFGSVGRK